MFKFENIIIEPVIGFVGCQRLVIRDDDRQLADVFESFRERQNAAFERRADVLIADFFESFEYVSGILIHRDLFLGGFDRPEGRSVNHADKQSRRN